MTTGVRAAQLLRLLGRQSLAGMHRGPMSRERVDILRSKYAWSSTTNKRWPQRFRGSYHWPDDLAAAGRLLRT